MTKCISYLHLNLVITLFAISFCCTTVEAQETLTSASPQELAVGIGHYQKAHSLLIAALREFDKGYKVVSTDKVLDSSSWRGTVLEKAKELEVILAPQAREIKVGSKYSADSRLLKSK